MEALDQLCSASTLSMVFGQAAQSDWSPGPQHTMELRTQKGGAERCRNIIRHEYASIPLLWWSWDFRMEECWITHLSYLVKLAALWCTGIVRENMWPSLTLSRNPNFICRDCLFIIDESTCKSSFLRDAPMLLPALQKKEPSLANKRVIPVDIFPSMRHFYHPYYLWVQTPRKRI